MPQQGAEITDFGRDRFLLNVLPMRRYGRISTLSLVDVIGQSHTRPYGRQCCAITVIRFSRV
jgi:hypothetical protein